MTTPREGIFDLNTTPPVEGTLAITDDAMTVSMTITPGIIPRPVAMTLLSQELAQFAAELGEKATVAGDTWMKQVARDMRNKARGTDNDPQGGDQQ